ncbi:MAG: guanylate kinase [Chloroflexi bacterium]|jgi:guanylate kinase|nr:guanylate kinase [Chloroflexota bacterium]
MEPRLNIKEIDPREFNPIQPEPLLIVISGLSGAGKDAIIQRLKERGLPFHFVVTTTSRPKRENEVHGVDYFFVTDDEFRRMVEAGEMLEYAEVYGQLKGVTRDQVFKALQSGQDVIMRLDVQGAATIRQLFPEALLIFITVPNQEALLRRLIRRETETEESLRVRLEDAHKELQRISEFDYILVNEEHRLEDAVDTIIGIINAEHHRVHPRKVRV